MVRRAHSSCAPNRIDPQEVTYRFDEYSRIYVLYSHGDLTPWTHKRNVKKNKTLLNG
jgi:hypothetical protein